MQLACILCGLWASQLRVAVAVAVVWLWRVAVAHDVMQDVCAAAGLSVELTRQSVCFCVGVRPLSDFQLVAAAVAVRSTGETHSLGC